jgi:D-beta-D-heptose 7-phosphate kinase/D-beta-D-heptose 1-phosphate adenosyltransferase
MEIDFNILNDLNQTNVLVVGDIMLDKYLNGQANRISPEAPVPIIDIINEEVLLGGAGNVVKNLISFGVKCSIISVVGVDEAGNLVSELVDLIGVNNSLILKEANRVTTQKNRIIAGSQQVVRYDKESRDFISQKNEDQICQFISSNIDKYDIILLSDYNKGMLTHTLCQNIIELANSKNIMTVVDPKGNDYTKYKNSTLIKPNLNEAEIILDRKLISVKNIEQGLRDLKKMLDTKFAIITLAEKGIAILDNNFAIIPTKDCQVYDVTGAGDTVLSSLAICLSQGLSLYESCVFANLAASIVVEKSGSSTTTIQEILKLK